MSSTINNPSIPYVGALPVALQDGHIIRIQGVVNHSAICFSINLQCGNSLSRNDIALHLSPVFSPPPRVVRNSFQNGQWGPEESHGPPFPSSGGQNFEILVLAEPDEYKIAVNGQHFTEFKHRLPLYSVSYLAIDGDVAVHSIGFESSKGSQHGTSDVTMPIGFINPSASAPEFGSHRPSSPYGGSGALPYPTGPATFGPQPSSNPYGSTSPSYPFGPPAGSNPYAGSQPYGPPPGSPYGGSSPSHPYGPPPPSNPYGGSSPSHPYGPPPGSGYPTQQGGYPSQGGYPTQGGYPGSGYPSQPGSYPGTTVVYPGQEQKNDSGSLGGLTALGTALAGGIGGAMMGGKHKKKHGHSLNPASAMMAGAPMLAGGLLGKGVGHKTGGSGTIGGIPIGGAVAGGAAALAGAYVLSKTPMGKVMKPKKMKKLYKHKHKLKHGFGGFYSSSSSSSSEEE